MVNQVTAVAVLMIVQGALEIIMGIILTFVAFVAPAVLANAAKQGHQNALPGLPPDFAGMATAVYLVMAVAGLVPGFIRVIAGIMNLRYRGRSFGIFSLFLGLLSIATCYCSLTSVGLTVYGLIVYFNADVARAFTLASKGHSVAEIKDRFGPERRWESTRRAIDDDRDERDDERRFDDDDRSDRGGFRAK